MALGGLGRIGVGGRLTFHGEEHGLADVGAHAVAGLAEVVANVLFQDVADQQGAVGQDLDAAGKGHWVILLGVPTPWKEAAVSRYWEWTGCDLMPSERPDRACLPTCGHPTAEPRHLTVLAPHSSYCMT